MKVIKVLLFMMLLVYEQSHFSINELLDYLQETGYYDIIQQIKYFYGDDVAICLCKELV